jgi:pimeloyl-ACP methyl ester carboxylesterase
MELYFREYGLGEPIMFVHGLLGMSDNWISVAKEFEDDCRVILPDLRNHGQSPHHSEHSFQAMSEDLKDLIMHKDLSPVILVGHSMGGKVVMQTTKMYPNLVKQMIIIDISPRAYSLNHFEHKDLVNHAELLDFMFGTDLKVFSSRGEINNYISRNFNNEFIVQLVQKNIRRGEDHRYEWKPNALNIRNNLEKITQEIEFENLEALPPTMFIFGSRSPYFTSEDYTYIEDRFAGSEIAIVENAGHAVHVDNRPDLVKLIKGFIEN